MISLYLDALTIIVLLAVMTWLYSVYRRDVSIVDSLWSLMFLAAGFIYLVNSTDATPRALFVFCLLALWALRLSIHLTVRNHGQPEDRRYKEIRRNNEPNFAVKSLYIIFGLQGLLAWVISVPLLFALSSDRGFHWLDLPALLLWLTGFIFETVADWQLYRHKKQSIGNGEVMRSGLWAYTRHPNYFGEFCIWWSFYLFAIPAGGMLTFYAPLLMSILLLKVSGVVMMEKDISNRRPGYRDYIKSTNAFFPGQPRMENT